jgi:hypothetical protein
MQSFISLLVAKPNLPLLMARFMVHNLAQIMIQVIKGKSSLERFILTKIQFYFCTKVKLNYSTIVQKYISILVTLYFSIFM